MMKIFFRKTTFFILVLFGLLLTDLVAAELNLLQITEYGKVPLSAVGYPHLKRLLFYKVNTLQKYYGVIVYDGEVAIKSCLVMLPDKNKFPNYSTLLKLAKPEDCDNIQNSILNTKTRTEVRTFKQRHCSETEETPACEVQETLNFDSNHKLIRKQYLAYDSRRGTINGLYYGDITDYKYAQDYLQALIVASAKSTKNTRTAFKLHYSGNALSGITVENRIKVKIRYNKETKAIVESYGSPAAGYIEYYYEHLP